MIFIEVPVPPPPPPAPELPLKLPLPPLVVAASLDPALLPLAPNPRGDPS